MTAWSAGTGGTVNSVLTDAAQAEPDRIFLDIGGKLHSYGSVAAAVGRLACGLRAIGVAPGQTVGTMLDNNIEAVLAWFAINKLGAVAVPINTAYKGDYLGHQLADSGAAIVIVEGEYLDRLRDIADAVPQLATLIVRGAGAGVASQDALTIRPFEAVACDDDGAPFPEVLPSHLSMLIYTSGTTGPSKGCMISHGYACNLARQSIRSLGRTGEDIYWTALPLFHMNATATGVLATAMLRGRMTLYPRFSLSGFWPDIRRSGATVASLLGSMHPLLANAPDTADSQACHGQLRAVSAAPFPRELQDKWRARFGVQLMGASGYGFTEAAMVATGPLAERKDPNSSGPVAAEFEVAILDDDDNPLPPDTAGEVACRPLRPNVMFSGYWKRPDDTLRVMSNLWLHTGDIGKIGENGEFYFLDRKKDYLRRRGENVSSFELERTFHRHPDIADVAVHAVPSAMGEDDVKVTCVLNPDATLSERELCAWSVARLPYFAVPRYIEFRSDLPRNPTGKILKFQLRDEGCTAATWDRETSDLILERR